MSAVSTLTLQQQSSNTLKNPQRKTILPFQYGMNRSPPQLCHGPCQSYLGGKILPDPKFGNRFDPEWKSKILKQLNCAVSK